MSEIFNTNVKPMFYYTKLFESVTQTRLWLAMEVGILTFCILITTGVIIWNIHKTQKTMNKLSEMIDSAVKGTFTETTYDESKLSALEGKLNRYLSSCYISSKNLSEEKDKIKSFISDISHQTKTPIANIILYSDLIAENEQAEENQFYTEQLHKQAEKLKFLIDALIKTSRLETGIITVLPVTNSVSELLQAIVEEIKPKADAKSIDIVVSDSGGQACFDKKWTIEALYNVLDNAVKYTNSGGRIEITGYSYEMFYRMDITDNGIGIREEEYSKIFGRFYRVKDMNQYEGVGIGLYLSREIITLQGGYIKVASELGKGSIFSVFLPI
jgi:signal transduction histidine kinase